jgi:hypothetical protein
MLAAMIFATLLLEEYAAIAFLTSLAMFRTVMFFLPFFHPHSTLVLTTANYSTGMAFRLSPQSLHDCA